MNSGQQYARMHRVRSCAALQEALFNSILDASGDISEYAVLDAGCGDGRLSRMLADRAKKVIGVDINAAAIRAAKRNSPKRVRFRVSDIANLRLPRVVDHIVACCVLNELPLMRLPEFLLGVNRNLCSHGTFIVLLPHPAFSYAENNALVRRKALRRQDYMNNGYEYEVLFHFAPQSTIRMREHHFSLSFLVNAVTRCGFHLRLLQELSYNSSTIPSYLLAVFAKA